MFGGPESVHREPIWTLSQLFCNSVFSLCSLSFFFQACASQQVKLSKASHTKASHKDAMPICVNKKQYPPLATHMFVEGCHMPSPIISFSPCRFDSLVRSCEGPMSRHISQTHSCCLSFWRVRFGARWALISINSTGTTSRTEIILFTIHIYL
jgi:hypothetical protein